MKTKCKYIVTKEEVEHLESTPKTHFLNDNAQRSNKALGDLAGIKGFGFHLVEIEPGRESTEFHMHYHEDECVYILEGLAEAQIGDDVISVKAGDFIGYPAGGDAHSLVNTGDALLKLIVVGQRLNHDVVDYPNLGKRLFRPEGLNWNLVDTGNITEPEIGKKS